MIPWDRFLSSLNVYKFRLSPLSPTLPVQAIGRAGHRLWKKLASNKQHRQSTANTQQSTFDYQKPTRTTHCDTHSQQSIVDHPKINTQHTSTDTRKPGTNNYHRERRLQSTVSTFSTRQPTIDNQQQTTTTNRYKTKIKPDNMEKSKMRSENSSVLIDI